MKRITPFFNGFDKLIDSLKYREISIYNIKVKIDYNKYTLGLIDNRLDNFIYQFYGSITDDILYRKQRESWNDWADIIRS